MGKCKPHRRLLPRRGIPGSADGQIEASRNPDGVKPGAEPLLAVLGIAVVQVFGDYETPVLSSWG